MSLKLVRHQQARRPGANANDIHMSFGMDWTSQSLAGLII